MATYTAHSLREIAAMFDGLANDEHNAAVRAPTKTAALTATARANAYRVCADILRNTELVPEN